MSDTTPEQAVNAVPADLQAKVNSIRALATTYNILQKAYLPYGFDQAVGESLSFLGTLHKQVLEDAKTHPDADKVPELQAMKSE